MTPTPEQQAIIQAARSSSESLLISAMAGCAKTTSLLMLAKELPVVPTLAVAFNVKTKKELERKFPKHVETMTLNGLGHRAWARAINRQPKVDTNKVFNTIKTTLDDMGLKNSNGLWSTVNTLVKGARHAGLVPEPIAQQFPGLVPDEYESWEAIADAHYMDINDESVWVARRTLRNLISQSFQGTLDYDDQIYMSTLFGGVFPKFATVLVDEAQDLSPLNHIQVSRAVVSRLIVCGDPRQAIYAFRGADSSSMESLRGLRDSWLELPLTVTWRCPKAIVARQQIHALGFTAAPTAPEGEFHDWTARESWSLADVKSRWPDKHIAILSRNNAPIIAAGLRIIRQGIGCTILGADIGKSLITLSKKIFPADDLDAEVCREKIIEWRDKEISLARANNKEERVAILHDRAECLLAVVNSQNVLTSGQLRDTLVRMFEPSSIAITLSTGHKAKGLEWPIVIHLDPWRVPSKFAIKANEAGNPIPLQQDFNLRYVIETRSQQVLINANLEAMQ